MTTIEIIISALLPLVFSVIFYLMSNIHSRLNDFDVRLRKSMSQEDVRLLLNDKLGPIKEDMERIEEKVDQLLSLYYKKNF